MSVTAIIPTYNEEDDIVGALDSVEWCEEVVLVDSQSTDQTREIARERGAKVVDAPKPDPDEPFDHLRRLGIEAASYDLVLFIDADERFPLRLQERLQSISERPTDEIGVVRAPILNYLGDEPLSGGFNPSGYTPTLVNPEKVEIKERVHKFIEFDDSAAYNLEANPEIAVRHQLADSIYDHWQSQRRYAKIAGSNRDFNPLKIILAPPWGVYHHVVENGGWKDGFAGIGIGLCYGWFLFEAHLRSALP